MSIWKLNQKLKIILILLVAIIPAGLKAEECDCWPVSSTAEAVKGATMVFAGEILQLKRFGIDKIGKDYKEFAIRVRVVRVWKGPVTDYVIIRTPAETEHCGIKFETGQNWLIYAIGGPIPLVTKCSRTSQLNTYTALNDQKTLGEGTVP